MHAGLLRLGAALCLTLGTGCYSTTAVVVHDGSSFQETTKGTIVAGDKQAIYLQAANDQSARRIEKKSITRLRHPGESKALPAIAITAGLIAGIAGGIALFDGLAGDGSPGHFDIIDDIKVTGGAIALGVGIAGLGFGIPALIASNASESDSIERMRTPPPPSSTRLGIHATLPF